MESDIKLLKRGTVQIEGKELHLKAHDIKLDNLSRRKKGASGHRRAMVHDNTDGLTINFNGDYPGGVTMNGNMKCDKIEMVQLKRLFGHTSLIDTIATMKREMDALNRRIAKLEKR